MDISKNLWLHHSKTHSRTELHMLEYHRFYWKDHTASCQEQVLQVIIQLKAILSTLNRIPTRGQQHKRQSCLLPVDSCHGTIIVTSDCTIVTSRQHLYQTIVQVDKTIVLPRKLATGSICNYLFCYCPLVGILFEVLRIV